MPLPGQAGGVGVDAARAQQPRHRSGDDLAAPLFPAADRQHHGKIGSDEFRIEPGGLVLLVYKGDGGATGAALRQRQVLPAGRLGAVKDSKDQPSFFQFFPASANALGLDGVLCLPQTGGVEPLVCQPSCRHSVFTHHVLKS